MFRNLFYIKSLANFPGLRFSYRYLLFIYLSTEVLVNLLFIELNTSAYKCVYYYYYYYYYSILIEILLNFRLMLKIYYQFFSIVASRAHIFWNTLYLKKNSDE